MTHFSFRRAVALSTVLLAVAGAASVRAQDNTPPPMPQGGPFGQGQGGAFPGGQGGQNGAGRFGRGGGQGGQFPGMGNFATGTVASVDAAAGTITLDGRGGQTQTVQTSSATTIQEQVTGTIADLKVGDTVRVAGVPTTITASQITEEPAGAAGAANPFGGAGGGAGRFGGNAAGGGGAGGGAPRFGAGAGGAFPGGGAGRPGGQANVSAKVTSVSPFTLKMDDGTVITVKTDSTTKVSRTVTVALSALKQGDRIIAIGQTGTDGTTFTATTLRVNMNNGFGGGQGGQGRFGQGGQGGQGGQFGQGGQGGQRGQGRRRGGGGQGGQGGQFGQGGQENMVAPGGGNTDVLLNGE